MKYIIKEYKQDRGFDCFDIINTETNRQVFTNSDLHFSETICRLLNNSVNDKIYNVESDRGLYTLDLSRLCMVKYPDLSDNSFSSFLVKFDYGGEATLSFFKKEIALSEYNKLVDAFKEYNKK